MTQMLIPALVTLGVLYALHKRVNVYEAFVCGAKDGLLALVQMLPYMAAILSAAALLARSGAMDALQHLLAPALSLLRIPAEAAGVILLRPLSGSASMGVVAEIMRAYGADSRTGRLACIISSTGETIFFTASMYLGAAGLRQTRGALAAALTGYAAGVVAAALITP